MRRSGVQICESALSGNPSRRLVITHLDVLPRLIDFAGSLTAGRSITHGSHAQE